MKVTFKRGVTIVCTLCLFNTIAFSNATVYSCNRNASCGCSTNSATVTRIVGGESSKSATWGWVVSISIAGSYLCGGSIISSSWVMTAAHCVKGFAPSQIIVYAGSIVRFSGTQHRTASQTIVHSRYNGTTLVHDIALLKLASPLTMSDPYVSVVCLPAVNPARLFTDEWPAANTTVVAVGWGKLNESGPLPATLQQVTLQTVYYEAATCARLIGNWHTQLCAGVSGGGKNVCYGDSGGPLMMFTSSNQWVVIGLTSYGVGCAEAAYSAVYTRVAAYHKWINATANGVISDLCSADYDSMFTRTTVDSSNSESISTISGTLTDPIDFSICTSVDQSQGNTVFKSTLSIFVLVVLDFIVMRYSRGSVEGRE